MTWKNGLLILAQFAFLFISTPERYTAILFTFQFNISIETLCYTPNYFKILYKTELLRLHSLTIQFQGLIIKTNFNKCLTGIFSIPFSSEALLLLTVKMNASLAFKFYRYSSHFNLIKRTAKIILILFESPILCG